MPSNMLASSLTMLSFMPRMPAAPIRISGAHYRGGRKGRCHGREHPRYDGLQHAVGLLAPASVTCAGAAGAAGQRAVDVMEYREYEIERIARQAFEAARKRRGKVTSVDKRNVLETSRMWREIVHRVQDEEYSDVELEDLLVDNAAMQLISRPADFDVVVTENMFGDILSDEAAQITGSLGMLASASLDDGVSLFGPSAGSAPDIAGLGVANPLAQILSVAMLLTYALDMGEQAAWIESAVARVLDEGWRTRDIADVNTPADKILGTTTMGDKVVAAL